MWSNAHVQCTHAPPILSTVAIATLLVCCSCEKKGGSRVSSRIRQQKLFISPELVDSLEAAKLRIRADLSSWYWWQISMGCGGSKGGTPPPPHGQPVPRGKAGEMCNRNNNSSIIWLYLNPRYYWDNNFIYTEAKGSTGFVTSLYNLIWQHTWGSIFSRYHSYKNSWVSRDWWGGWSLSL